MKIKEYEERAFAFIDILGFKKAIKDSELSSEAYRTISDAINYLSEVNEENKYLFGGMFMPSKLEIGIFSDSIAISANINNLYSVILKSMFVVVALMKRGLLCRGGIAIGKGVHKGNIIFGPGFLSAYELEISAAIYPRIILNNKAMEVYKASHNGQKVNLRSIVKQDDDGFWFVDIFSCPLPQGQRPKFIAFTKSMILEELEKLGDSGNPSIIGKYRWLENQVIQYEA